MNVQRQMASFILCMSKRGRERQKERESERAETKAFLSVCVLSCPSFPGHRSGEASYFWLLSAG